MMVIFHGSATNFELETAATFSVLEECLASSLYRVGARETKMDVFYYRQLHADLLRRSIKLNESYSQAAFELRIGRLSRMFTSLRNHVRGFLIDVYSDIHTSFRWRRRASATRAGVGISTGEASAQYSWDPSIASTFHASYSSTYTP